MSSERVLFAPIGIGFIRLGAIPGLCSSLPLPVLPALTGPAVTVWKRSTSRVLSGLLTERIRPCALQTGYWSCSKFLQSLLEPHCSILKFLIAPLTPPGSHTAHSCFFALPSHSHLCLDGESGEIVTTFIIISTVDDLTWAFSPLIAALKLTRIWRVCHLANLAEPDQPIQKLSGELLCKSRFFRKPSFI